MLRPLAGGWRLAKIGPKKMGLFTRFPADAYIRQQ